MIQIIVFHTLKNIKNIPCSFAYKIVCVDDKFSKPDLQRKRMQSINLLKKFWKSIIIVKNNKKAF